MPRSQLTALPSVTNLGIDVHRPVAVVCGHGNSSRIATAFLRAHGVEAYSMHGGMAAWETVYLPRILAATPTIERTVQLDRVGKGALSYVLVSEGEALVIDPGRHLDAYETLVRDLGARPVAVLDTHVHADYLSGGPALAARWRVPYRVHAADARSPYDETPARFAFEEVREGQPITFGRAALRPVHTPGHTLGSTTLISDDGLAFTGDFVFVQSVGRPDLGGQAPHWTKLLWTSLERARREWSGELLILPAHYASEVERRADRTVAARWDAVLATNPALALTQERDFLRWAGEHAAPPPDAYRTIKLANLGLVTLSEADAETMESGPNVCAI
jgi:glyoxylase-like metal-dependent hydrolase (beta-lactamase superfamily II)